MVLTRGCPRLSTPFVIISTLALSLGSFYTFVMWHIPYVRLPSGALLISGWESIATTEDVSLSGEKTIAEQETVNQTSTAPIPLCKAELLGCGPAEWPSTPFAPLTTGWKRPLILYAFFETKVSLPNLRFFLEHGLHSEADFIFILNGDTDVDQTLLPNLPNVRYHKRENKCYDLGAFAEVLQTDHLYKGYKRYILMNSSIRGPFVPYWGKACWSDAYLERLTGDTKLVGSTISCEYQTHVQSMIWALDAIGLETLLYPDEETLENFNNRTYHEAKGELPPIEVPGINSCPSEYWQAVAVEVNTALLIESAGWKYDVMMTAFQAAKKDNNWTERCPNHDMNLHEQYFGTSISPWELIFIKTNRGIDNVELENLSGWIDEMGYSSYDHCAA